MTALKNQWHEQRRQRQQELVERQQQVRDTLASFQQERQTKASQLRDDLSLFQLELQKRTSEFLSACTADRSLMAQQLSQDLSHFHNHLSTSVAALRQGLQSRIHDLQVEVQELLKNSQEQRVRSHLQTAKDLAVFIDNLRSDVQTYLSELELARQDRAQQLQQMLKQDRQQRMVEMDSLFREFADFRAELQQYCVDLRSLVWGTEDSSPNEAPQLNVVQPQVTPVRAAQPPAPKPQAAPKIAEPVAVKPVAPVTPASPPQPQPVQPEPVVAAAPPVMQPSAPQPEILTVVTSNAAPKPLAQKDSAQLEKEIYNHIHQVQGARLTEIEASLGINRFQAVDALRSLIKKGLITQRDRIYLIQEEVSL